MSAFWAGFVVGLPCACVAVVLIAWLSARATNSSKRGSSA